MTGSGQIPSGTVTLLFTDIEGSTRLWESEPEPMTVALRRHDEILRAAIEQAGGYVFKTVGDAFCAAFGAAGPAITAVLAAQRALGAEDWPTSRPVRVRMGLHTGVCEERDGDYFGPTVNRAARLEAVAHGGQVLVSGTTAELLAGSLADGTGLRNLGLHRLKDLGRPEQVFQLEADFLPGDFPPLASLDNPELPNNLPSVLSAFVGRDGELGRVRELVRSSRLVTLTGAGGSGKTRLALQAAAEMLGDFGDGTWLAELAPLTDGDQVAGAVAAALGLHDLGGGPAAAAVTGALADQDVLLLLDNCEHLIDAAAKFAEEVIRHCPRTRFLATSREPLGIEGELVYRVPSLSLPQADATTAEELAASDAVRLFAERAVAHQPGFRLDDQAAPLIATVCRRLDGIPLALELAAARLSSMSLEQVAARLDQRFRLLTGGSRNAMPRQQTLQAAVDWSFGLLNPAERETLARLSVFAGGFDLEAAEAVCTSEAIDVLDVLDLLGSLVSKSLVVADHAGGAVRYRLLETIRQYSAQELLRLAGDDGAWQARDRHAGHYLALAVAVAPAIIGHGQREWLRRLDGEWDNLRAALAHLAAEDRGQDILRLMVSLHRFFLTRGHREVLDYLRPVIDRPGQEPSALLADAMLTAASLIGLLYRTDQAQFAVSREYGEAALVMARAVGNRRAEAQALANQIGALYAEDPVAARAIGEQGLAIARDLGDVQLLGEMLDGPAAVADPADRRGIRLEGLACSREVGDDLMAAIHLNGLFSLDINAGRIDEASEFLGEAVALAEQAGGDMLLLGLQSNLAVIRLIQGRPADAAPLVRTCLLVIRRIGPGMTLGAMMIFAAACCATWQGDYLRAARLHGAGDADIAASLELRVINWSAAEQELRQRDQDRLRETLGEAAYQEAYQAGARLSLAQAIEVALGRDMPAWLTVAGGPVGR